MKITEIYAKIGITDPLKQKLVEPFAYAFGGKKIEGEADLSGVNRELVIDYFTGEAAAHTDRTKSLELQEKVEKKYGGIFSHYGVYEER